MIPPLLSYSYKVWGIGIDPHKVLKHPGEREKKKNYTPPPV
jgi:hypothetical protein